MKKAPLVLLLILLLNCKNEKGFETVYSEDAESSVLFDMIDKREKAMIDKDIETAMSQFSEDITWINSQGYYFVGKKEVKRFHDYLATNDSLDYYYEAGEPKVRLLDSNNALAYYSWKMFWYKKGIPSDTINKEIGLMTLTAKKIKKNWKWIAVTNQHTPWFYNTIEPVTIDE